MTSLKLFAASACVCSLAVSAFATDSHAASREQYSSVADPSETPAGFGTNAKVALLWHWSEGIVRSVGVSKVTRADKGVICVTPKVALDPKGIYPLVSVSPEESNTLAGFAGSRSQAEVCPGTKDIEVDTYQATNGGASTSNNVGFFLIIE